MDSTLDTFSNMQVFCCLWTLVTVCWRPAVLMRLVRSFWCCGWLLFGSRCSSCSSSSVWPIKGILCSCSGCGSGTKCCCCLYTACGCNSCLPGCEIPTDLWHSTKNLLSFGGSGSICCSIYSVHCTASRSRLSNTYVFLETTGTRCRTSKIQK